MSIWQLIRKWQERRRAKWQRELMEIDRQIDNISKIIEALYKHFSAIGNRGGVVPVVAWDDFSPRLFALEKKRKKLIRRLGL